VPTIPTIGDNAGLVSPGPPSPTKSPNPNHATTNRTFDYAAVRAQFEQMQNTTASSTLSPRRPPSRKFAPHQIQVTKTGPNYSSPQLGGPSPRPSPAKVTARATSVHPSVHDGISSGHDRPAVAPTTPPRPPPKKVPLSPGLPPRPASLANPKFGGLKKQPIARPPYGTNAATANAPSRTLPVPDQPRSRPNAGNPDHASPTYPPDAGEPKPQQQLESSSPKTEPVISDVVESTPISPPVSPRPTGAVSRARRPAVSHQQGISSAPDESNPGMDASVVQVASVAGMDSLKPSERSTPPAGRKRAIAIRPSKIVVASPVMDRKMSQLDPSVARRYVVKEVVDTEEVFVQDVLRTISGFVMPMRNMPKLITSVEMGKLFANIEMIMITSSEMAKELRTAVSAVPKPEEAQIGVVFSKNATTLESAFAQCSCPVLPATPCFPLFPAHPLFVPVDCRANSEALQLLSRLQKKSAFASALENLESAPEVASGGGLLSFLVKPVQRVCKYPLLLRELQRNTPLEHPDHIAVGSALEIIGRLVDKVNMTARETENISNLLRVESQLSEAPSSLKLIMPGRRFLREGRWMKISGRNTQERQVYLFNDMLIYAKPAVLAKNKFIFKGIIPLHEATFEPHGDAGSQLANSIRITRIDNNKSYVLYDDSEEESRDEWLSDIEASRKESHEGTDVSAVVGAFHMAETSPDARKDAITMLGIETKISGWTNDLPQRRFVASGPLKYVAAGSSDTSSDIEHRGILFLFNDSAVFARQVKHIQSRVPFQFREVIDFASCSTQDLELVDLDGDKTVYHAFLLASTSKQKRIVLLFGSVEEKSKWLDLVTTRIADAASRPETDPSNVETRTYSPALSRQSSSSSTTRTLSVPSGTLPPSPSVASVGGVRLPAGVSSRGSFAEAPGPTLKTKKSFFGKKLGYISTEERRGSGLASPRSETDSADEPKEEIDEPDRRESVEGFEVPPWDSDDSSDSCTACASRFSATNRKHHCRNCGKVRPLFELHSIPPNSHTFSVSSLMPSVRKKNACSQDSASPRKKFAFATSAFPIIDSNALYHRNEMKQKRSVASSISPPAVLQLPAILPSAAPCSPGGEIRILGVDNDNHISNLHQGRQMSDLDVPTNSEPPGGICAEIFSFHGELSKLSFPKASFCLNYTLPNSFCFLGDHDSDYSTQEQSPEELLALLNAARTNIATLEVRLAAEREAHDFTRLQLEDEAKNAELAVEMIRQLQRQQQPSSFTSVEKPSEAHLSVLNLTRQLEKTESIRQKEVAKLLEDHSRLNFLLQSHSAPVHSTAPPHAEPPLEPGWLYEISTQDLERSITTGMSANDATAALSLLSRFKSELHSSIHSLLSTIARTRSLDPRVCALLKGEVNIFQQFLSDSSGDL
jgi:hypothetical protein